MIVAWIWCRVAMGMWAHRWKGLPPRELVFSLLTMIMSDGSTYPAFMNGFLLSDLNILNLSAMISVNDRGRDVAHFSWNPHHTPWVNHHYPFTRLINHCLVLVIINHDYFLVTSHSSPSLQVSAGKNSRTLWQPTEKGPAAGIIEWQRGLIV